MSCPSSAAAETIDVAADAKALPQTRVSADAGDYLHWSGDGHTLYWTQGPQLFARRFDLAAFDGAKPERAGPSRTSASSPPRRIRPAPSR